ncbi:type 1 fimbrial protein [Serratia proteamaculans]|uniref:fimbrial protein n=1 Tax=Serratia proteamaculans TaxID=28151 RepID=UPI001075DF09|nr:fimbrial protein [Serratia proteamaculans]TFZ53065.1 type 1 fimbrial protein [Serratia proteamaculans]
MKLNKYVLAMVLAFGASAVANAATPVDNGHGKVTFTGSIIDAPCSIDADSIDQTVELGQVSNVLLKDGGKSKVKPFEIRLESCSEATAKTVQTTFTGASNADGLLAFTGTAKGANIAITDQGGNLIKLGTASKGQALQNGNNNLSFAAYLQGEDKADITPGDFKAVADFTLAYQ